MDAILDRAQRMAERGASLPLVLVMLDGTGAQMRGYVDRQVDRLFVEVVEPSPRPLVGDLLAVLSNADVAAELRIRWGKGTIWAG
jgi:hypothetical protein